mmetsp:Transcript_30311/g.69745  ORF Transcript_30311/g.69745 Transcript_30311/m.69745 type:complete len:393 (+) Transcript_30311:89-1267(+)
MSSTTATWISDGVREALCHTPRLMRSASMPPKDVRGGEFRSALRRSPSPVKDYHSPRGDGSVTARLFDGDPGSQASAPQSYRSMLCHSPSSTGEMPSYARSTESWESKLGRPLASASTLRRSRSTTSTTAASGSLSAPQDHLWQELNHDDLCAPQKEVRLKGEVARAVGRRGRESKGMPWRQIPTYSRSGHLAETGDPQKSADVLRRISPWQKFKAATALSPRLTSDAGAVESLSWGGERSLSPRPELSCRQAVTPARQTPRWDHRSPSPSWLDFPDSHVASEASKPSRRLFHETRSREMCPFAMDSPPEDVRRWHSSPSPLPPFRQYPPTSASSPRGGRCERLDRDLRKVQVGTKLEPGYRVNLFEQRFDAGSNARRSPSPIISPCRHRAQ